MAASIQTWWKKLQTDQVAMLSSDRVTGLPGRQKLYATDNVLLWLVDRKSRFLRKDAQRFQGWLTVVAATQSTVLNGVVVVTQAPICSKAKTWLLERDIEIGNLE